VALVRIKLADSDRARYEGLPEWLEFDLYAPMLSQVKLLKQQVGLRWDELVNRSNAYDMEALGAVYWLAVRAAGHDVTWDDFEVSLGGVDTEEVADDPNSSAPDGAKPTSTPSPRPSRASTASTRGRSSSSRARSSTPTSKK